MNANNLGRAVFLLISIPVVLTAQWVPYREPVMLKNWAAPLYWQLTQARQEPSGTPLAATANLPLGTNALVFVGMTPCRIADTRTGQGFSGAFGPPGLIGSAPGRTFPIQSNTTCPIPSIAQAYSFNLTVVAPAPLGFITAYPTPGPLPLAATLNWAQSLIVGNAAVVPAGTGGSVDFYANANTDLVIDINGYYAPPGDPLGNTGLGMGALQNSTTGSKNTAIGGAALQNNTTGSVNTASGYLALFENTTGGGNTASGAVALQNNTTGNNNTATGAAALQRNTTGSYNTASGFSTLTNNTTGSSNTAEGWFALDRNTTGNSNTGLGYLALENNTVGSNNIAIGVSAGANITASNNVDIANQGSAGDGGTIRVGTPGTHSSFFVAGVRGVTTSNNNAVNVVIDSNGQLGTLSSSRRFKEDIHDMGEASSGLLRLRPVTFRYQKPFADGSKPVQYGLIAEEVAEVYPDLVTRLADGQVETVKYQVLDSMLLNELQKEHQRFQQQVEAIRLLQTRITALEQLLSGQIQRATQAGQ